MTYNFSDIKKQNDFLEKELLTLKEDYQKQEMSDRQVEQLYKKIEEAKKMEKGKKRQKKMMKIAATAAVLAGTFIILPNTSVTIAHAMEQIPFIGPLVEVVTFRDYEYETERNKADIEVPEIQPVAPDTAGIQNSEIQDKLDHTTDEINAEIQKITDDLIKEFEAGLESEMGYQDVLVKSEILASTPDYFTLKLICYQGAGSGYEWNYFYTIDLNTGERLKLKDIFVEGADYITPISENIKQQMREQMEADENVYYWLEDEVEEWNFKQITEETSFYLNEKGNVVIGFNEGDVAPMYMGTVEFEIPGEVTDSIRK